MNKKWTTKNSNLRSGDILLSFSSSWLSRTIRRFMNIYRKKLGLGPRTLYSHTAGIIEVWGEIYVVEALMNGVNISKFQKRYAKNLNRVKIITPKKGYSNKEKIDYCKRAQEFTFDPTRYDFLALAYQADMIARTKNSINKEWNGPKGYKARKRMYCSELTAILANLVRPNTFDRPWTINPLDTDLNKYYKEKVIIHE